MKIRTLLMAGTLGVFSLALAGCPTAPGTYAIWVVNSSDAFTVTNVKLVDTEDPENFEEYPDDVATNTTHVVNNVPLASFDGKQIRVEIDAEAEDQVFNDGDFDVTIPGEVQSGDVYVIVVRGASILDFGAEYVPLDDASKGALIMKGYLPPIN